MYLPEWTASSIEFGLTAYMFSKLTVCILSVCKQWVTVDLKQVALHPDTHIFAYSETVCQCVVLSTGEVLRVLLVELMQCDVHHTLFMAVTSSCNGRNCE